MERIIKAYFNSVAAFKHLGRTETAFQQELIVLVAGIPLAFVLAPDAWIRLALIGSLIFVLIVEVLNTAIEAACNALSREFNADIKVAKDAGSLAVLLSIGLAASVWMLAAWAWYSG